MTTPLPTDPAALARLIGTWPTWGRSLLDLLITQVGRTAALRLWEQAVDVRLARENKALATEQNATEVQT